MTSVGFFDAINSYKRLSPEIALLRKVVASVASSSPLPQSSARQFSKLVAMAHSKRSFSLVDGTVRWEQKRSTSQTNLTLDYVLELERLLTPHNLNRFKQCCGNWCDGYFLDESKNCSRIWCLQEECEELRNKAKAHTFYNRHRRVKPKIEG
jgi:predicted RNA-binding Zn ribbon-like protein